MASIKKYNGSSFENAAIRKYGTSTDTITTLPADVYADGNNATVGLVGNMEQTGVPSPSSIIIPQECGERTGNLLDINNVTDGYWLSSTTGQPTEQADYFVSDYIPVIGGNTYNSDYAGRTFCWYKADKTFISTNPPTTQAVAPTNAKFLRINAPIANKPTAFVYEGSTALPYEPYGIKIPISSANTTTPVYLSEVESTRQIKKIVFTGGDDENWSEHTTNTFRINDMINDALCPADGNLGVSNAFVQTQYNNIGSMTDGQFTYGKPTGTYTRIAFKNTSCADVTAWKAYLQAQYAAGTPVTVWYVLATATTGIVNEPLMKIGDYADTVSGITVPTITGKDTFDVQTTLKPSEVELTYTGWHDATVKEWDGSEWQ